MELRRGKESMGRGGGVVGVKEMRENPIEGWERR
jgi:hypothetical protein